MSAGTDLRALFENAPVGIAQCDRQGTITVLNAALSATLGNLLPATQDPRFVDLVSLEDRDLSERSFRQLFSGERSSFQIENRQSRSDGGVTCVRWTAWRVDSSVQPPDYVLLLAESCDEEQRVVQAEQLQAVGRMAGSIAHDFNNLLTGILLYCDLMMDCLKREGSLPQDRLRRYIEEIRCAGVQAAGVVQQLLTLPRPRNLDLRPLSLNQVAEAMRNLLLRLIGENIELSFHLDPEVGLVKMDPAQAQQILLNLVLNARDAMPGGGRILVETRNCSVQMFPQGSVGQARLVTIPCALFVVSDNGGGMSEETRQRAFQAYFTTKEEGKGSGLGLATVRDIVAGRGGLVQLDSDPGRGTRVTVLLPSVSLTQVLPAPAKGLANEV
jgi:two-component system cell cycle sensor histidine kinase/response regulator CckA